MSIYHVDGVIVNTDKSEKHWKESTRWNGNNHISVNTGSQWEHETLYKSSKGRYYLIYESQWQGSTPSCRFITDEEAVKWLLLNDHELPEELESLAEVVEE